MPERTELWCRDAASNTDKVYVVTLDYSADLSAYTVVAEWGRRGGTLRSQTKYQGGDVVAARRARDRLVQAKVRRGYDLLSATGGQTIPPGATGAAARPVRRRRSASILSIETPRLQQLQSIDQRRMQELLADPRWCAQPALEGVRRIIRIRMRGSSTLVDAMNQERQPAGLPEAVVRTLQSLGGHEALLDARIDGDVAWIWDLLYHAETTTGRELPRVDWLALPYWRRLEQLEALLGESLAAHVRVVPTSWSCKNKRDLSCNAQLRGMTFRQIEEHYAGGNSGQLLEFRRSA